MRIVFLLLGLCVGSCLAAETIRWNTEFGQVVLTWTNHPGQTYVVQCATNLLSPVWQPRVAITGDSQDVAWADDSPPVSANFYRIVLSTNATLYQSLQNALHRACTNQGIAGASASALFPDGTLWVGTSGTSDGVIPIRPHTPFEVASVTKTFVAATVLRLVDEGRLSLEDKLSRWLPSLNDPNIPGDCTIRQLLGHSAGVYNFGDEPPFQIELFTHPERQWQPEETFQYLKPPYFSPGAGAQYSNTGYVLLGMVIRSATGSTVAAEMRRTVLERADLRSTFMGAEETWYRQLPHPHLDLTGDGVPDDLGDMPQTAILTSFWTSGAEVSTAADLAKFGVSLFESNLLSPSSLNSMRTFLPLAVGSNTYDYGLGLMRFDVLGREHWAHSGGLFGFYSWFSYCPATRVALGVAYNSPNVKVGANLPGELLIVLSTLPNAAPESAPSGHPVVRPQRSTLIPFLNAELPFGGRHPTAER